MTFLDGLRDGRWLTRARLRVVAVMLVAAGSAAILALIVTSNGVLDWQGRPLGTDFANVYAAGRMALEGRAAEAWDWAAHHAAQQAVAGRADVPFYGWHYPPLFLLIAAPLAALPYLPALILWQAATLTLFVLVIAAILRPALARRDLKLALLLALAFPAALVNLLHGQNGFLTAALLGGALALLDRRPLLAGVLIGCLAYKPQFGLLMPLVLVATGRGVAIASATLTTLLIASAATFIFGPGIWPAFIESLDLTRRVVLEAGDTGFYKLQSLFAALRLWGVPLAIAHGAQGALILVLAAFLVRLWRSPAAHSLKAAGLVLASLMATPYTLDYDLVILGVAIAFLVRGGLSGAGPWPGPGTPEHQRSVIARSAATEQPSEPRRFPGLLRFARNDEDRGPLPAREPPFGPFEASLLAFAWAVPLVARTAQGALGLPLGLIALIALFALTLHRAGLIAAAPHERLTRVQG